MAGANGFKVEGLIVAALPNGTFTVRLRNGHELTGFLAGKARRQPPVLKAGMTVTVQVSVFDLSQGRILPAEAQNLTS